MLEKQPRHRYASMDLVASDLRRFISSEPVSAEPPPLARRMLLWTKRNRVAAALSSLSLLVVATAVIAVRVIQAKNVELARLNTALSSTLASMNNHAARLRESGALSEAEQLFQEVRT